MIGLKYNNIQRDSSFIYKFNIRMACLNLSLWGSGFKNGAGHETLTNVYNWNL